MPNLEQTRLFLLGLPRVEETMQWGTNLVYWVLDKSVGGRIFAVMNTEPGEKHVLAFAAGPEAFHELQERDGVVAAPYFARAHWVAMEEWSAFNTPELQHLLTAAHGLVCAKLPPRAQTISRMPLRDYRKLVRERRALAKSAARG